MASRDATLSVPAPNDPDWELVDSDPTTCGNFQVVDPSLEANDESYDFCSTTTFKKTKHPYFIETKGGLQLHLTSLEDVIPRHKSLHTPVWYLNGKALCPAHCNYVCRSILNRAYLNYLTAKGSKGEEHEWALSLYMTQKRKYNRRGYENGAMWDMK